MPPKPIRQINQDVPGTFLSIFLLDYSPHNLAALLDSIYQQTQIKNFEIILCDDIGDESTWDTGNQYARKHPGTLTLVRNQFPMGLEKNQHNLLSMARGVYYARLSYNQEFNPTHILEIIATLDADPLCVHELAGRVSDRALPRTIGKQIHDFTHQNLPLVSICIYNYNYGRYLTECLESVAAQTYSNIEICFSDNASTDDSWEIAVAFARRYPGRMSLIRNRENFGATANLTNTRRNARGKYVLLLCSDDAIQPGFIERCVTLLEKNPDAAFALVHRDIIDETGNITTEPPFYDQTCLIPGEEQAAVYMMAAVNPSISQVLYNHPKMLTYTLPNSLTVRWFGQRLMDFFFCLESPIVYIKEPLLLNRVHGQSDGAAIDSSLVQGVGQYMLALQFAETASQYGLQKPAARLGAAIEKVSRLCLRYCTTFLLRNDETTALRYLHLAQALWPEVAAEDNCLTLKKYWSTATQERQRILAELSAQAETTRKVSYPPPPGSIPC